LSVGSKAPSHKLQQPAGHDKLLFLQAHSAPPVLSGAVPQERASAVRDFNIEQEYVPAFRAALQAEADPLAAGAGETGDIVFLDTKTFEQDYMAFCDNFCANNFYPEHARSEMRQRRESIFPYLGQPLLHGGLSHDGFMLNVFVDKSSGVVVHWESQPEPR
jgi:hypothetical protein